MSVYGEWKAATISPGSTESSAVNLGRDYDYIEIQIPEVMGERKLSLKISETLAGTYYDLGKDVTTDSELFGRADVWKLGGYQFIKVVTSAGVATDWLIRVRGTRS